MNRDEVLRHFEESGALLKGHFKLSSGLHSDRYLQCARVLQWPARAGALGAALGAILAADAATVVVSPAMGGLIIGHEVGRALGVRAIFAERVEGTFALRRGFGLEPGDRVVVVEDVVTTGKSTGEVLDLVGRAGATTVACAAIIDRRGDERRNAGDPGALPFRALARLDVASYTPQSCPLCAAGQTVVAPGSRFLGSS